MVVVKFQNKMDAVNVLGCVRFVCGITKSKPKGIESLKRGGYAVWYGIDQDRKSK